MTKLDKRSAHVHRQDTSPCVIRTFSWLYSGVCACARAHTQPSDFISAVGKLIHDRISCQMTDVTRNAFCCRQKQQRSSGRSKLPSARLVEIERPTRRVFFVNRLRASNKLHVCTRRRSAAAFRDSSRTRLMNASVSGTESDRVFLRAGPTGLSGKMKFRNVCTYRSKLIAARLRIEAVQHRTSNATHVSHSPSPSIH